MGSSGGSSGKGGGKITTIDWLMNPAGSIGKSVFGIQADPISDATASMFQSTVDDDYRREHGGYSLGNSWLADIFNPVIGGKTEQEVNRSQRTDWQQYYASMGKDKWGEDKKKDDIPRDKLRKTTTEEEGESLLG